ncbi:MAG: hypothetical protein Q9160_006958 [Pyrenula sp. 1 TL-2023]
MEDQPSNKDKTSDPSIFREPASSQQVPPSSDETAYSTKMNAFPRANHARTTTGVQLFSAFRRTTKKATLSIDSVYTHRTFTSGSSMKSKTAFSTRSHDGNQIYHEVEVLEPETLEKRSQALDILGPKIAAESDTNTWETLPTKKGQVVGSALAHDRSNEVHRTRGYEKKVGSGRRFRCSVDGDKNETSHPQERDDAELEELKFENAQIKRSGWDDRQLQANLRRDLENEIKQHDRTKIDLEEARCMLKKQTWCTSEFIKSAHKHQALRLTAERERDYMRKANIDGASRITCLEHELAAMRSHLAFETTQADLVVTDATMNGLQTHKANLQAKMASLESQKADVRQNSIEKDQVLKTLSVQIRRAEEAGPQARYQSEIIVEENNSLRKVATIDPTKDDLANFVGHHERRLPTIELAFKQQLQDTDMAYQRNNKSEQKLKTADPEKEAVLAKKIHDFARPNEPNELARAQEMIESYKMTLAKERKEYAKQLKHMKKSLAVAESDYVQAVQELEISKYDLAKAKAAVDRWAARCRNAKVKYGNRQEKCVVNSRLADDLQVYVEKLHKAENDRDKRITHIFRLQLRMGELDEELAKQASACQSLKQELKMANA